MIFTDKYPNIMVCDLTEEQMDEYSNYDLLNKILTEDTNMINTETYKYVRLRIALKGFIVLSLIMLVVFGLLSLVITLPLVGVFIYLLKRSKGRINWSIRIFKVSITMFKDNIEGNDYIFEHYFDRLDHVDVRNGYNVKFKG